jgi:8-oxo-dGTP pyrophosphatase MutT (NUDIX family)
MVSVRVAKSLPLQVAAVCYRWRNSAVEFLLVNTNGGNKWTFPKGSTEPRLSHSQAAAREALEEAGAIGTIEPRHFHVYLHSKGVFWQPSGIQEFVVKAFLMKVSHTQTPGEPMRNPTWATITEARKLLSKGREVKYTAELLTVLDRASEILRRDQSSTRGFAESRSSRPLPAPTRD